MSSESAWRNTDSLSRQAVITMMDRGSVCTHIIYVDLTFNLILIHKINHGELVHTKHKI